MFTMYSLKKTTYEQYKYDLIGNLEENFVAVVKSQNFYQQNFPLEIFLLCTIKK